jgi:predicted ArsR family transcriptional regulator
MNDLFDWKPPPPRLMTEPRAHKGVATSEAAANSMRKCSGPMQIAIMRYIDRKSSATYDEICRDLNMEKPTSAGRLNDLTNAGFITSSGTRPTRSGRPAKVHYLTTAGFRFIRENG